MRTAAAIALLATLAAAGSASDAGGPKATAPAESATSAYRLGAADLAGLRGGIAGESILVEGACTQADGVMRIQGAEVPSRAPVDLSVPASAVGERKPYRLADGRLASYAVVRPPTGPAVVLVFWAVATVSTHASDRQGAAAPAGH